MSHEDAPLSKTLKNTPQRTDSVNSIYIYNSYTWAKV